jgi:hypothetical protein
MTKKKLRKRIRQLETHVETASNTIVFLTKELLTKLGTKIHPKKGITNHDKTQSCREENT